MRTDPVIIGGTGGSGTSLFARMLRDLGLDIGREDYGTEWQPFAKFARQSGPVVCAYEFGDHSIDLTHPTKRLRSRVKKHPAQAHRGPWGWKMPRACLFLTFLATNLPNMRYIHVVRDGRDMALSENQRQATRYGGLVLGDDAEVDPVRSAAFWSAANCWALAQGGRLLGERFSVVRYEDLIADPTGTLASATWAGLSLEGLDVALEQVQPGRVSSGRWRDLPPERQAAVTEAARPGLEVFGYLDIP